MIAYTDVVFGLQTRGATAKGYAGPFSEAPEPRRATGHPEEGKDAAGTVDSLSNKANHSAIVFVFLF